MRYAWIEGHRDEFSVTRDLTWAIAVAGVDLHRHDTAQLGLLRPHRRAHCRRIDIGKRVAGFRLTGVQQVTHATFSGRHRPAHTGKVVPPDRDSGSLRYG